MRGDLAGADASDASIRAGFDPVEEISPELVLVAPEAARHAAIDALPPAAKSADREPPATVSRPRRHFRRRSVAQAITVAVAAGIAGLVAFAANLGTHGRSPSLSKTDDPVVGLPHTLSSGSYVMPGGGYLRVAAGGRRLEEAVVADTCAHRSVVLPGSILANGAFDTRRLVGNVRVELTGRFEAESFARGVLLLTGPKCAVRRAFVARLS